jgi:PAS domain S-box-containing protein
MSPFNGAILSRPRPRGGFFFGLTQEITERKQAESALRESEEHFRTLFELGPMAVYSCDASGVIRNFNRRAAELWGRVPALMDTDERFCGSFRMFRPDGSFMPHAQCPMAEVASGTIAEVRDAEVLIERQDGSRVAVIVNILPLKNQRGETTGAINCFYDITERKAAEDALRKWEYIFNHAGWAVVGADPEANRIIMSNLAFAQMHGYTVEEMLGKPLVDTLANESRAEFPRHVDSANERGDYIYESMHLRKEGTDFPTLTHVSDLKDAEGHLLYRAATVRDITERKEAEQRQILLTNELAHHGKNLLAVVMAIVSRSLSGTRTLTEARDILIQRLHALARSAYSRGLQRRARRRNRPPRIRNLCGPGQSYRPLCDVEAQGRADVKRSSCTSLQPMPPSTVRCPGRRARSRFSGRLRVWARRRDSGSYGRNVTGRAGSLLPARASAIWSWKRQPRRNSVRRRYGLRRKV